MVFQIVVVPVVFDQIPIMRAFIGRLGRFNDHARQSGEVHQIAKHAGVWSTYALSGDEHAHPVLLGSFCKPADVRKSDMMPEVIGTVIDDRRQRGLGSVGYSFLPGSQIVLKENFQIRLCQAQFTLNIQGQLPGFILFALIIEIGTRIAQTQAIRGRKHINQAFVLCRRIFGCFRACRRHSHLTLLQCGKEPVGADTQHLGIAAPVGNLKLRVLHKRLPFVRIADMQRLGV